MPCYSPLQGFFMVAADGSRSVRFSNISGREFKNGRPYKFFDDHVSLPCGRCIGCRLERSRQWALRCLHEAKLYAQNCFITLTYSDKFLPNDGSLNKKHFQDFMKRLRAKFNNVKIRFYHCGEYGEQLSRPHYHAILFGFDFPDKKKRGSRKGVPLYESKILEDLWGKGYCVIGDVTFESAAYVARYCTKKVTGAEAEAHYKGKHPEYATMSLKPGIGLSFYDRFKSDIFPSDFMIVRGAKCKPPRYYDKILERENPLLLEKLKESRVKRANEFAHDSTYLRLKDREKCQEARFTKLVRELEI